MKLVAALLLLQSLTIGVGEERQSKFWRTWAPRWDVFTAEAEWGPVVANIAHKRGVAGLNPDRVFPTASVGLQHVIARPGPWTVNLRGAVYVDWGHIAANEKADLTTALGLWGRIALMESFRPPVGHLPASTTTDTRRPGHPKPI